MRRLRRGRGVGSAGAGWTCVSGKRTGGVVMAYLVMAADRRRASARREATEWRVGGREGGRNAREGRREGGESCEVRIATWTADVARRATQANTPRDALAIQTALPQAPLPPHSPSHPPVPLYSLQ